MQQLTIWLHKYGSTVERTCWASLGRSGRRRGGGSGGGRAGPQVKESPRTDPGAAQNPSLGRRGLARSCSPSPAHSVTLSVIY